MTPFSSHRGSLTHQRSGLSEDEHVLPDSLFVINNQGEIFYPEAAFKYLLKYVSIYYILSNQIIYIHIIHSTKISLSYHRGIELIATNLI